MWSLVGTIAQTLGISQWILWIVIILAILYIYGTWNHATFKNMSLPGPTPWPLLGNFNLLLQEGFKIDIKLIKKFGRIFGYFEGVVPVLIIAEPEYIKQITVKDFDHFTDRRVFVSNKELRKSITVVKGEEWKTIRNSMTPSFSGGKMKKMAHTIDECAMRLVDNLKIRAKSGEQFEIRQIIGCFTMDVVAETLFGISIDSQNDYNNEFVIQAKKAFDEFNFASPAILVMFFAPFLTSLVEKMGIGALSHESVGFFYKKVHSILEMRRGMKEKPNDMLQLLLDAHGDETNEEDKTTNGVYEEGKKWKATKRALTDEEIIANSMLFFLVGYETTASTIAWMIYNLCLNEDCQEKLYQDVTKVIKQHKVVDYETVTKMTYLEQVFNETLRVFPPAMRTDRVCVQDVDVGPYHLTKGSIVNISIIGVHNEEEFWPEPEKFNPDRFAPENKDSIVPYSFLPFGAGPRNCIGMRLANVEAKIGLARIIENFKIKRCEKTEVPIKLRKVGLTIPENGIWVRLESRN